MGCGQSKISDLSAKQLDTHAQHVESRFSAIFKSRPQQSKLMISVYLNKIIDATMTEHERIQYIAHLESLAFKLEDHTLLHFQLRLNDSLNQHWILNKDSLRFFYKLESQSPAQFNHLITWLEQRLDPEGEGLKIDAAHINLIIKIFYSDCALLPNALDLLCQHLTEQQLDYKQLIAHIRQQNLYKIKEQTHRYQLLHHDIPHALEVEQRSMHILDEVLAIYSQDSNPMQVLKIITSLCALFHDLELQASNLKERGLSKSAEQCTASHVSNWLIEAFKLNTKPQLQSLIHLIANRLIVLGTTMILGRSRSIDLSELFFNFRAQAQQAAMQSLDASNLALIHLLDTSLLVIGLCDKTPATFKALVTRQASNPKTQSLAQIKAYFPVQTTLQLEHFFSNKALFSSSYQDSALNKQAFFIALVPHFSMSVELNLRTHPKETSALIQMLVKLREQCHTWPPRATQRLCFKNRFNQSQAHQQMQTVFFNMLARESSFSRNQLPTLSFANEALSSLQAECYLDKETQLISMLTVENDAYNIRALGLFYARLSPEHQRTLSLEVLLAVTLQAGFVYAATLNLNITPMPPESTHNPSSSALASIAASSCEETRSKHPESMQYKAPSSTFFNATQPPSSRAILCQKDIDEPQRLRY